jgi:hypothetical protein
MPDDLNTDAVGRADVNANIGALSTDGSSSSLAGRDRSIRFPLRSLLVLTAVVAIAIGIGAEVTKRASKRSEEAILRQTCIPNLENLALTFGILEELHKVWPPSIRVDGNGQPLNSWRFHVYPFFPIPDEDFPPPLDLKAAWNSPVNKTSASDKFTPYGLASKPYRTETCVFGISGPGTAFDDSVVSRLSELPSEVIVVMEVADSKIHWMQPGDYDFATLLAATGRLGDTVKGLLPDRIHVLFADGNVWALSPDTPIDAVKPFFTITGAKAASREESLLKYRVD